MSISRIAAHTFRVALLFTVVLVLSATGAKAQLDNKGKDFIFPFLPNTLSNGGALEVHLSADTNTDVTVEYPVNAPVFTTTVPVVPGTITIVTFPNHDAANTWTLGVADDNAVRASAANEFTAYSVNRKNFTSDAGLVLPIDTMNTDYIVTTYNSSTPEFGVVAAFDNTTVTINPVAGVSGGHAAGVDFDIVLNAGEGAVFQSGSNLTGTTISADKPIGMASGVNCANVPSGASFCDHIYEHGQPVQSWGQSALVANLPNRENGTVYRVLASEDNTTVNLDGVFLATLNRGEFHEPPPLTGNHFFEADKPIFVTQFMTGSSTSSTGLGDPAQGNMVPAEQFQNAYTFSTVGGGQFIQNHLIVIADNADLDTIELDGSAIGAGAFSAIAGTDFSAATIALTSGTHSTSSTNGHMITVAGYNQDDSYLYPGGASFQFINSDGDANPPLCDIELVDAENQVFEGTATDNRPNEDTNNNGVLDPGEDLNNNGEIDEDTGIFFVQLDPGSDNLELVVDAFVPGAGMVAFTAQAIDKGALATGIIRATDGAGNTCVLPVGGEAECDEKVVTSDLFTMDGNALELANQGKRVRRQIRKAGGSAKSAKKLVDQLQDLYVLSWVATWVIDEVQRSNCSNAEVLCVETSNASTLATFNGNIDAMNGLLKKLIKKLNKAGAASKKVKRANKRRKKARKAALAASGNIPASTSTCN